MCINKRKFTVETIKRKFTAETNVNLLQHSVMKFDRINKHDLYYYGEVKSSVTSKGSSKRRCWCHVLLLAMVHKVMHLFIVLLKSLSVLVI